MRFIPSFVHGALDYTFGFTLATAPWLLGFNRNATATTLAVVLGIVTVIYSLLTRYELGVVRIISFRIHLLIDLLLGIFLMAVPYLFRWPDRIAEPFFWFGMYAIATAALTRPHVVGLDNLLHSRY